MPLWKRRSRTPGLTPGPHPTSLAGRVTAREAVEAALGSLMEHETRLIDIISDSNIDHQGRARVWEIFFDLPQQASVVEVTVAPCGDDDEDGPLCLRLQVRPLFAGIPEDQKAFMAGIARGFGMTLEELELRTREKTMSERPLPLPIPFNDSPDVVAAAAARDIDFLSGPTDITLSTTRVDGVAMWQVQAGRRTEVFPFRKSTDT